MIEQYDIKIDDLPPEFREIAEHIGLEPALRLVEIRAGEGVYVPKPEKICRAARDRAIRAEFDGRNYRDLARKYGLTLFRWPPRRY
jgi:Mor family transcriptional regulator